MTTNQEGRQAAIRDSTSTAYGVAADWNALFDDAGISAGTFNERLLAWINAELSASHSNLVSAMQAYAEDAGYDGWEDMATLVLAMNGAETLLDGETQGLAFDFTDQSALIIDTGTPANNYDSTGIVSSGSLVGPSGKLTYTSPSNKLTMQSDGVIRYQAHNLILQSETLDNAYWTKTTITVTADADGTADLLTETGSGATFYNNAPDYVTVVNGGTYALTWRVRASANVQWVRVIAANNGSASQSVQRWFDIQNGVVGSGTGGSGWTYVDHTIADAGNGYYDCTLVFTTADTALSVWINSATADGSSTRGSSSAYYVARCHVYRYPANTDYIKTTSAAKYALPLEYDTSGNCLGLLVEEARTNVVTHSNAFENVAWTKSNVSVNDLSVDGPLGSATATTITDDATSGEHRIYWDYGSNQTNPCLSIFAKAGTAGFVGLSGSGAASGSAVLNLSTGEVTNVGGSVTSASSVNVGNGWWRFTVVMGILTRYLIVNMGTTAAQAVAGATYSGSGSTIYLSLAQKEINATFPTSPIITYGAAATRLADIIAIGAPAFPFAVGPGTYFIDINDGPNAGAANPRILSMHDGAGSRTLDLFSSGGNIVVFSNDGTFINAEVGADVTGRNLIAVAMATDDVATYVNGVAGDTDNTLTPAVASTTLSIGNWTSGDVPTMTVRSVSYVPRRRANSELQTVTTP